MVRVFLQKHLGHLWVVRLQFANGTKCICWCSTDFSTVKNPRHENSDAALRVWVPHNFQRLHSLSECRNGNSLKTLKEKQHETTNYPEHLWELVRLTIPWKLRRQSLFLLNVAALSCFASSSYLGATEKLKWLMAGSRSITSVRQSSFSPEKPTHRKLSKIGW